METLILNTNHDAQRTLNSVKRLMGFAARHRRSTGTLELRLITSMGGPPHLNPAGNNLTAIEVAQRAYDGGLRVWDDLSVAGFHDILIAGYTQPALITARAAGGQEYRLGTRLVVRESSASPRSAIEKKAV